MKMCPTNSGGNIYVNRLLGHPPGPTITRTHRTLTRAGFGPFRPAWLRLSRPLAAQAAWPMLMYLCCACPLCNRHVSMVQLAGIHDACIHNAFVHDASIYNACIHNACIRISVMHVSMMHVSYDTHPDPWLHVWCMYLLTYTIEKSLFRTIIWASMSKRVYFPFEVKIPLVSIVRVHAKNSFFFSAIFLLPSKPLNLSHSWTWLT